MAYNIDSKSFDSIIDLRGIKGTEGSISTVFGFTSLGSVPLRYRWNGASIAADDGVTVIRVPSVSTGAWELTTDSSIKKEVGVVFSTAFNNATELSRFTNTGSATFSLSGNSLSVSGGSSNYSNFFTSNYVTTLNNYELSIEFTSTTAGTGIAIGFSNQHIRLDLSSSGNRGKLYIENSTAGVPTTIATSSGALTYTDTTDKIRLVCRRIFNTIYATAYNITTPSNAPVSIKYQQVLVSGNPTLQFFSNPTIYAYGGTQLLTKFEYVNKEYKKSRLLLMGDSNTVGFYQGNTPWAKIVKSNYAGEVAMMAIPGIASAQLVAAINEVAQINPEYVFLNIGTNDAVSSVTLATYLANIDTIIKAIVAIGAIPIIGTVIPNSNGAANTLLQSYNTNLTSIYGSLYSVIDTNGEQATAGAVNATYNDGTHMKPAGGLNFASLVLRTMFSLSMPVIDWSAMPVKSGVSSIIDNQGSVLINFGGTPGAGAISFNSKTNNGSGTACFDFVNGATAAGEMLLRIFNQATNSTNNKVSIRFGMFNSATAGTVLGHVGFKATNVTAGTELTEFSVDNTVAGSRTNALTIIGIDSEFKGDIRAAILGKGIQIKEGANARMGIATLIAGTITVTNTSITANTRIFLSAQETGTLAGILRVSAKVIGTSFTISTGVPGDNAVIAWELKEAL